MSTTDDDLEGRAKAASQSQDVVIGRDFQVDGQGNRVDFSQTTIDQSHAHITHITQVAFDEVKACPLNPRSPYIGLRKFEVRDRDLFFGRDRMVAHLQDRLQHHFLLVLGASGSGKSSLVRAGLIPRLAQQRGSGFRELIFTPDRNPFESFRASLTSAGYRQSDTEFLRAGQPDCLLQAAQSVKPDEEEWLIFIDQFEELFTLCPEGLLRQRFIDGLVSLVRAHLPSVDLIVAMRADFLDRLSAYPTLSGILQRSELITDLGDDELRLAIEQPAVRHGVMFEPGLVGEIIQGLKGRNDTGEAERISLPLLQYTLKLLWESSGDLKDRILRTRTYRQIGGVRGALQRRVDEIYNSLSVDEQQAAKHIFLHLVDTTTADVGTTAVGKAVSRRATLKEFSNPAEQRVLERLIDASLLVSDRPDPNSSAVVELAHETLIDSWDTLKSWIEESKPLIRLRNQLKDDALRWHDLHQQQAAQAEAELWQGYKLQWLLERRQDVELQFSKFSSIEIDFLASSEELRDRQQKAEIERQRKQKWMAVTIAVAFMGVLNLGIIALWMWQTAERRAIQASVKETSALFVQNQNSLDPLLEAINAGNRLQRIPLFLRSPELQADVMTALAQGVYWVREKNRLEGHTGGVESVAFSPDGNTLATASYDRTVRLWTAQGQSQPVAMTHDFPVWEVVFSPDGSTIASADEQGIIHLWSDQGIPQGSPIQAHDGYILALQFDPQGDRLASAGQDGTIRLWSRQGERLRPSIDDAHAEPIRDIAFSADGQTLASASADGTIRLWSPSGDSKGPALHGHQGEVLTVRFSPSSDPRWMVSGDEKGNVRLWKATGGLVRPLTSDSTAAVRQVAFSPDGGTIAAGRNDGTIDLWSREGQLVATLQGHTHMVNSISFNANGTVLASASDDNRILLWEVNPAPRLEVLPSPVSSSSRMVDVSFNPQISTLVNTQLDAPPLMWALEGDHPPRSRSLSGTSEGTTKVRLSLQGDRIVTGGLSGSLYLWTGQGEFLRTIPAAHHLRTYSVDVSPQGDRIASGGYDNLIKLWDIDGNLLFSLPGHRSYVNSVEFSADGRRLVSASEDGTAKLWDLEREAIITTLSGHLAPIWEVAFSPDNDLIATASSDRTVRLWDGQGNGIKVLEGHGAIVNSVQFSADGQFLYSGSNDQTIHVWRRDGTLLMALWGHGESVNGLSVNEGRLASAGSDGRVILWHQGPDFLTLDGLLHQGCTWVQDYLATQPSQDHQLCRGYSPANPPKEHLR